ncbi:MAG: hypothetical protein RLY71_4021 [Pseudomonadota bacterium]
MNRHVSTFPTLAAVRQWRVARDGILGVADATVWITRDGDADDHVLAPGQTLAVRAGQRLTAEPVRLVFVAAPGRASQWRRQSWQLLARLAGRLGAQLLGLARSAELQAGPVVRS